MTDSTLPIRPMIESLRLLIGVLASSVVALGAVLFFVLPHDHYPPIWVPWALGGIAVVSHLLSRTVGSKLPPVPAGTPRAEAKVAAKDAFQSSVVLRFALSEAVAIVATALSFAVTPSTWMTYVVGGVLALILLRLNAWPSDGVIRKAEQQLDRAGGQSFLSEALSDQPPGPVDKSGVVPS